MQDTEDKMANSRMAGEGLGIALGAPEAEDRAVNLANLAGKLGMKAAGDQASIELDLPNQRMILTNDGVGDLKVWGKGAKSAGYRFTAEDLTENFGLLNPDPNNAKFLKNPIGSASGVTVLENSGDEWRGKMGKPDMPAVVRAAEKLGADAFDIMRKHHPGTGYTTAFPEGMGNSQRQAAPQQQQYQPAPRRQGPIDYSGYGG
jgi:hypothetical protein